jgi:hypothetical protein
MQIQNKQASTPPHVHSTMQPPSQITVCKMYSCQYQPVKIRNQKEWHMPPKYLKLLYLDNKKAQKNTKISAVGEGAE